MARIAEVEWEPCLLTQHPVPELERRFERETGRPGLMMRYFGDSPWLADTMLRMSVQITTHVAAPLALTDLAGLAVSQDNSCRFCFGMQRAFMRLLGTSEKQIARLELDLLTADFSPRERAVVEFARRVSQARPLASMNEVERLRTAGFNDTEIVEFAGLAGVHLFFNRMSTFIALPPEPMEKMPDRWWARVFRPLLAIRVRRMRHHASPVQLLATEREGPLSDIVNGLDGLPLARDLRIILDRLWGSCSLPPRTVSVMLAVVARALGASRCEDEAVGLLREYGMPSSAIEQLLTHLSSPALSDLEQRLVPLVRETVWYRPAAIQRHCAQLRDEIGTEQFLDFCGAAALFNMLCRLVMLADMRA